MASVQKPTEHRVSIIKPFLAALALALLQVLAIVHANHTLDWEPLIRGGLSNTIFYWLILAPTNHFPSRKFRLALIVSAVFISALINTHISINGALPSIDHAQLAWDEAFITALLRQSALYIWLISAATVVAGTLALPTSWLPLLSRHARFVVLALIGIFLTLTLIMPTATFNRWYAKNLIEFNLPKIASNTSMKLEGILDGRGLVDSRKSPGKQDVLVKNVILVLVEGLGQAHLDAGWLPRLSALEQRGFKAQRFINHQRQTNRGLFSLFCGAYPNLVSGIAKADLMALSGLKQQCLPRALEEDGIRAAFIQAAPLSYMSKDLFASAAGFSVIKGQHDIPEPELQGSWGVDDRSLLREGFRHLNHSESQRNFIVLLTSGTHPPYRVPGGRQGRQESFHFADEALGELISRLENEGLLRDTVVIISSDESSSTNLEVASNVPADNLGYLLALGGGIRPEQRKGLMGQVDMPATVASFLGHTAQKSGVPLLEEPHPERRLYAGNTFKREVYEITFEEVVRCSHEVQCEDQSIEPRLSRLIALNDLSSAVDQQVLARIQGRDYDTAVEPLILGQLITNQQQGSTLLARIELDTSASPKSELDKQVEILSYDCEEKAAGHFRYKVQIPGGETAVLRYMLFPQAFAHQCHNLWVTNLAAPENSNWRLNLFQLESIFDESDAIGRLAKQERTRAQLPRIAHAGGGFNERTYTNSIEALDYNYSIGFRAFEVDFVWTEDRQLVCGHDWEETTSQTFGIRYESPPTLAQFKLDFKQRNARPCTLPELDEWFEQHPDALLVTDIKERNLEGLTLLTKHLGFENSRVIPQIYSPDEYAQVQALDFDRIILTLYRYPGETRQLLEAISEQPLFAITLPLDRVMQGLGALLNSVGISTYAHTINESEQLMRLQELWGIDEVYTDFLAPEPDASNL
ncbi:MAG: sulfatase-like hydrolase/transferase [Halioglobus sp.]